MQLLQPGLLDYKQAWELQESYFNAVSAVKLGNRDIAEEQQTPTSNHLILCEHPHVYTLGKSGEVEHLLVNETELAELNATFYKINRGGDITYHGPGQLVGYPILDLDNFYTDIHRYLREIEETIILLLADYGIVGGRSAGFTGVWIEDRKICAIGVRTSRWITMHGFAFNVNADLSYFSHIVPCGIEDKAVTSLAKELGYEVPMDEVIAKWLVHFQSVFGCEVVV